MTCTVDDLHFPFEFGSWVYSNDVKVQHMQESSSLGNSTTLVIDNCTYEQMGTYQCLVIDARKSEVIGNSSTQLNVEGKCLLVIINVRENRSGNQK
jgi:hypothetical protein